MKIFSTALFACVILCFFSATLTIAGNSTDLIISNENNKLSDVPQDITGISISLVCSSFLPNTMFTIVPSDDDADGVAITTTPPDLVEVRSCSTDDGKTLYFQWNVKVATSRGSASPAPDLAQESGVRITVPSGQLQRVDVSNGFSVNIRNGFTSLVSLGVSFGATMKAEMDSSTSSELALSNEGNSTLRLISNVVVTSLSVTEGGSSFVEAPTIENVSLSGGSRLSVQGNVTSGSISGNSTMTVTGAVASAIDSSGGSTIITGSGCENINSSDGSQCTTGVQIVEIGVGDLSNESETMNGANRCPCSIDSTCSSAAAQFIHPIQSSSALATAVAVSTVVMSIAMMVY